MASKFSGLTKQQRTALQSLAATSRRYFTPQMFNVLAGAGGDDSSAIAAAVNAAASVGRGIVDLGAGSYWCESSIGNLIGSPITIKGYGAELRVSPQLVGDLLSFSNCWYGADATELANGTAANGTSAAAVRWKPGGRKSGVTLEGFRVTGERGAPGNQNGIIFYDRNDRVTIRDVAIEFIRGYGLVLSGVPSNPVANAASVMRESHVENVDVRSCGDRLTARPAFVFNSTDKGQSSGDDACNYVDIINCRVVFPDGLGFQTNCYNLNSNSHSNNTIRLILDTPQGLSGASSSNGSTSISNGILTVAAGGTIIGTFQVGQYLCNANVPIGTYIAEQLSGTAGGVGVYRLANRTLDVSSLSVAAGGNMNTLRTNIPMMQVGGGHASETWDVVLNASNTLTSNAYGIEFNHFSLHQNTAKTVNSQLTLTNGNMDTALAFTVINSLHVSWKLRNAVTSVLPLNITTSVVIDLLERAGTDPAIGGGSIDKLHVRPGGQDIFTAAELATMPAVKFPNCKLVEKNGAVYTQKVSDGTSWITI